MSAIVEGMNLFFLSVLSLKSWYNKKGIPNDAIYQGSETPAINIISEEIMDAKILRFIRRFT